MRTEWYCRRCGPVLPLHATRGIGAEAVAAVREHLGTDVPLWCPWPLPPRWTVTGVGWAGDERSGARASALVVTGPDPLSPGPADIAFVAEDLGVGLGNGLGGLSGSTGLEGIGRTLPHAKVPVGGHPTPLWAVPSGVDRSVYVGEARALWLYVIAWPAAAGYLLADQIELHDLAESQPVELVYGAPSTRLSRRVSVE
jgi:uncharacterized protein DUF6758